MKKAALYISLIFFFLASWCNRFTPVELDMSKPETVEAEIKGAVNKPGVYQIPWNSTLETLTEQAGGFKDTADTDSLNLSAIIRDREVITVREKKNDPELMVSIGSATEEELTSLPGIGPSIASRIVEYRTQSGFTALEDLKNVKGIGEKTFEKLRDFICL